MQLTFETPKPPVTIVPAVHRMHPDADPAWRKVEAVACRFKLPSHRTAVRVYLYSVLRDVKAMRKFGDHLLYPGRLRRAIKRGREVLEEARRQDPELMASVLVGFGVGEEK